MLLPLLAAAAFAASPCEVPVTAAELAARLAAAEGAYVAMDIDAFTAARVDAGAALPCLAEPLTRVDVAAVHRLDGLAAYLVGDEAGTVAAFRSALAAQPGAGVSSTIAPQGNPLHALVEQARDEGPGAVAALAPPPGTVAFVDAQLGAVRPTERPWLLQLVATSGELLWTGRVAAGEEPPEWGALDLVIPERALANVAAPARRGPKVSLLLAGGGAALVAGGLYGSALAMHGRYVDPESGVATSRDELATTRCAPTPWCGPRLESRACRRRWWPARCSTRG